MCDLTIKYIVECSASVCLHYGLCTYNISSKLVYTVKANFRSKQVGALYSMPGFKYIYQKVHSSRVDCEFDYCTQASRRLKASAYRTFAMY